MKQNNQVFLYLTKSFTYNNCKYNGMKRAAKGAYHLFNKTYHFTTFRPKDDV